MPQFDGLNCFFVHVPKTAGNSITSALVRANDGVRPTLHGPTPDETLAELVVPQRELQHLCAIDLGDQLARARFSFAVVRNPWDRLLSHYFFARRMADEFASDPTRQHRVDEPWLREATDNNFDSWLELRKGRLPGCARWVVANGRIAVDFVGKVETLDRDWQTISDRIGIAHKALPRLNTTSHGSRADHYDDRSRRLVAEWMADDIDLFGYRFDQ